MLVVLAGSLAVVSAGRSRSFAARDALFSLLTGFLLVAAAAALAYPRDRRLRDLVGRPPADARAWWWVGSAVPLMALAMAVLISALWLLSWIAPEFTMRELLGPDEPSASAGRPAVYHAIEQLCAVVLGSVAEELLFRDALLLRWEPRWGARRATLASAALFAVLHVSPVGAFVFALFATRLARRTGTLLVPMAMHVLHNALVAAFDDVGPAGEEGGTLTQLRWEAGVVALAFLPAIPLTIWLFRRLRGAPALAPAPLG